jgi:phosphate transport system substrate-binding protein
LQALPAAALAALLAAASLLPGPAAAADITGAGATFPYPIYAKWAEAYRKKTGVVLTYQPIGSAGGIRQIQNGTVSFGASDMPLKLEQLNKDGLIQFPAVIGGAVPVVNLGQVASGEVKLDGATLARIFLGEIKTWNDPAIVKLNPNARLSPQPIVVAHRSDGSGTTFIFTDYLSKVSQDWRVKVGRSTSLEWPTGIGAIGNEGVANSVQATQGAIGYVEYAYARQKQLATVRMVNKDAKTVAASTEAFQAAAENARWDRANGFYVVLTDQPGAASWPSTGASFILVHKQPKDPAAVGAALKFFAWAYAEGGKMAEELDYVPLPTSLVADIEKVWASEIIDGSGKPLYVAAH